MMTDCSASRNRMCVAVTRMERGDRRPALHSFVGQAAQHMGRRSYRLSTRRIFHGFSFVELLVVLAVVSVLAAILLPTMERSLAVTRQIGCGNSMRQLGVALGCYIDENNKYLAYGDYVSMPATRRQYWFKLLSPYALGGPFVAPRYSPGNVFSCLENPLGGYESGAEGYIPSFGITFGSGKNNYSSPVQITKFSSPSCKGYLFESNRCHMNLNYFDIFPSNPAWGAGGLELRHSDTGNVLFYDNHAKAYAAPPLPVLQDNGLAVMWVSPDYPALPGL